MPKPKVKRTREKPIHFMATGAERSRWERKAKESSMLLSHWIRAALDSAPVFDVTLKPRVEEPRGP